MSSLDVDRSVSHSPSSRKRGFFPPASLSLTHEHIQDALSRSPDQGATLVFMKLNLTYVGEAAAEELATIGRDSPDDESRVERVALGYNRLSALPTEFALLSRLRYLTLKHNSFTVFPPVLTLMSALDTLDISHNKIKRLPTQPGSLVNLRVFCFSRNKVTRLPTYMHKFHNLAVLEVERNPIDWPPKHIMERHEPSGTAEAMKSWIRGIQRWIESESTRGMRGHDDSGFSELESRIDDSFNWRRQEEFDETPHARSFSIDSTFSMSSVEDSTPLYTPASYGQSNRPSPLHIGILQSYSTDNSPTRSMDSYLSSPAGSETFYEPDSVNGLNHKGGNILPGNHGRNASYAVGVHSSYNRGEHWGKKSMPDLRTAKLNFTKKTPERAVVNTHHSTRSHQDEYSMPSPLSLRQDSDGSSLSSTSRNAPKSLGREHAPQISPTRDVPSMAFERNSYFRRLSTIPLATINTLPTPLLNLVDTARSILFAVCQIYQTVEHYTLHSIDERLSSILKKVLHPTSADMIQFINSLDRFDAMSRKMIPPPPVCRGVVESCRDTVAVFSKTVGVLALQLKVIVNVDDLRYLRSLLVQLYGAAAEISLAWQSMIPQMEQIKPFLHSKSVPSPPSAMGLLSSESHHSTPSYGNLPDSFPLPHPRSANGRSHNSRRHAGSFSSRDVELGRALPEEAGANHTSTSRGTLRAAKRQRNLTPAALTVQSPSPTSPGIPSSVPSSSSNISLAESSRVNHSRSGSLSSLQASSTSSSPSIPAKTTFLDLPSTSRNQVDKEALQAVQSAVEVAPTVWDQMEDVLVDVLDSNADVRESLERARSVTQRLSDMIRAMKDGDPAADKKILREDANIFLKTVVQLSNYVKMYGGARSAVLRTNMVKLTNSTEEFAILLHVSSFSPSPSTSRPYSPMLSASSSQVSLLNLPEEARLGPGLSRSRSAQPSSGTKIPVSPGVETSRSALPSQSFKLPIIKRLRDKESRLDINDPG